MLLLRHTIDTKKAKRLAEDLLQLPNQLVQKNNSC